MHSVMEGLHTIDVSIMLMPILMEMIALIGDMQNIEYDMGVERDDPERISDAMVQTATQKLKRTQFDNRNSTAMEEPIVDEMIENVSIPEDVSMANEMSGGLMSRGL